MYFRLSQDCEMDNSYNNEATTEELRYGYRRRMADEVKIEPTTQCYVCGTLLTTYEEVFRHNDQDMCSTECIAHYEELMEE